MSRHINNFQLNLYELINTTRDCKQNISGILIEILIKALIKIVKENPNRNTNADLKNNIISLVRHYCDELC